MHSGFPVSILLFGLEEGRMMTLLDVNPVRIDNDVWAKNRSLPI
jgi:hypothetical protein